MKSENGVTLIALITIIIVLIIIMSVGIYSGINSYKVIDFEKYKAQMQLIQNAVDELYEKNKNNEMIGNDRKVFGELAVNGVDEIKESFWKKNVATDKFGISLDSEEYYYLSAEEIESNFDLENIDISEYFIINYEKRYVFSVTPITVTEIYKSGRNTKERPVDIYCLYQLDEQQKVIDFKTDGNFEYNIYKEDYKQTVEIIHDINIEKVEINTDEGYVDIKTRNDYCTKVSGINTGKVILEIIKDCKIRVKDTLGNLDEKEIFLYNIPVLEKNMIPIIGPDFFYNKDAGKIDSIIATVSYINNPNWYNYSIKDKKINEQETIFATVINAITTDNITVTEENTTGFDSDYDNYYKVNTSELGLTKIKVPLVSENEVIKVWIPRNLREYVNNTYGTIYKEEDFEGTGMWVEAMLKDKKVVPANGEIE